MIVRSFREEDRRAVVALWEQSGLIVPWNDAAADIDRKLRVQPELFVVGTETGRLVGTAMGGYDGHRGWIYYLAVEPDSRGQGWGRRLVEAVSERLQEQGCVKVNIMVRANNRQVAGFYRRLGFKPDEVICLGKRLTDELSKTKAIIRTGRR